MGLGIKRLQQLAMPLKKIQVRERTKAITMHGFALYVLDEMENFNYINPCGMTGNKTDKYGTDFRNTDRLQRIKK